VHITAKSDLILRDLETLVAISKVHVSVCFAITTADDELGKKVEPSAPLVSRRFEAARVLVEQGIHVGILLMPVLPFLEDSEENITQIVRRAHECGVRCIVPWFGMSLRAGQREYYYQKLDQLFPGVREKYERRYGERYSCACPNAHQLSRAFDRLCAEYGIRRDMAQYDPQTATQLSLF
jgi:DNA repair photolyase